MLTACSTPLIQQHVGTSAWSAETRELRQPCSFLGGILVASFCGSSQTIDQNDDKSEASTRTTLWISLEFFLARQGAFRDSWASLCALMKKSKQISTVPYWPLEGEETRRPFHMASELNASVFSFQRFLLTYWAKLHRQGFRSEAWSGLKPRITQLLGGYHES